MYNINNYKNSSPGQDGPGGGDNFYILDIVRNKLNPFNHGHSNSCLQWCVWISDINETMFYFWLLFLLFSLTSKWLKELIYLTWRFLPPGKAQGIKLHISVSHTEHKSQSHLDFTHPNTFWLEWFSWATQPLVLLE